MIYQNTHLDRETADAVLDALNAVYSAMDTHGIDRSGIQGDDMAEYLDNIAEAFREKLASVNN